ncbi:MAG: S16 family serine protease [Candidatus Planktophila sp.]
MRYSPLPRFVVVVLTIFFGLALVAPLPFAIVMPGNAQNIFANILTVKHQKSYPATGRLDLMSIRVTNPNTWIIGPEIIYSWIRSDEAVYPRSAIYPAGTTAQEEKKKAAVDMTSSQSKAITAAFTYLATHPELGVSADQLNSGHIAFDVKRTGGPSGGMIFALGVIELLTPRDLLHGRHVSGTGTISADGQVGPIGGINEKIVAAHRAGAQIFLVPAGNAREINPAPKGLEIIIITNLSQAVEALSK